MEYYNNKNNSPNSLNNQNNPNIPNIQSIPNNQSIPNSPNFQNIPISPLPPLPPTTFLNQHGHYRNLRVYKVAEIIYDITYYFANKYLRMGDRTIDQMIQAARSGKQNIAEGNQAALTSSETEIKLTNVAKASLEELLDDYEDYLRVRNLQQWGKLHPRYEKMRQYARSENIYKDYADKIIHMNDEEIANLSITLIHQANFMLHKLLMTMQERFVKEGGIRERMFQCRSNYRKFQNNQNNQSSQNNPNNQSNQNNPSNPNTPNPPISQNPPIPPTPPQSNTNY
ncbi:MAG: four helix bundle suffix domain-containing protein [Bacteroidaceae bacterium]|nr:four helix bundle suffix domain-containing protein [Bacteroidaceae bacterium]